MTAVKPGLAAVELCPACPHSARLHGDVGCRTCDCGLTGGEILGAPVTATVAVAPPTPRSLDRLDPECACGHRRGLHRQSGSSAPCRRCTCRDFTAERGEADVPAVAAPAEPAPRVDPVPDTTRPDDHDDSSRRPTPADTTAAPVAAPKPPRRHQPRTAGTALMKPAGPSEDDADQGVTAALLPAAVTPAPDLLDTALWLSARWYCPSCIQWPHDPGACPVCRTPLQPVYLVTVPRELP